MIITIETTPEGFVLSVDGQEPQPIENPDELLDEVAALLMQPPAEEVTDDELLGQVPGADSEQAFLDAFDEGTTPRPVAGA